MNNQVPGLGVCRKPTSVTRPGGPFGLPLEFQPSPDRDTTSAHAWLKFMDRKALGHLIGGGNLFRNLVESKK
jgi:hypothetical protein